MNESKGYRVEEVEKYKTLSSKDRVKILHAVSEARLNPGMKPQELESLFRDTGHFEIALNCCTAYILGDDPFS